MEQDAFDLVRLYGLFLLVNALPIFIGIIAVIREQP